MIVYRTLRRAFHIILYPICKLITIIKFMGNGVKFQSFVTSGIPYVMVSRGGKMCVLDNFHINNRVSGNPVGCFQPCSFVVGRNSELRIGRNVGISQSAIVAIDSITIGDNVKIGGGCYLYSSDFHSLDPIIRSSKEDQLFRKSAPIIIHDNAFIGAHCIILKGVEIGKNSIVGAGSVVTRSIPENQIWAGNPAKYIRDN